MKICISILTAALLFLNSCTKQKSLKGDVNYSKVEEVLHSKIPFSQRTTLFEMLSPYEKAVLWKSHLTPFLSIKSLTARQSEIIREVINFVTPEIFRENTNISLTGNMAALEYKAKAAFPIKTYFLIFEMYNSTTEDILNADPAASAAAPPVGGDCYCRSNSWCGSATGSDLAICLWNDEGSSCNSTSSGCGLIGWSSCRGVCCLGATCY